MTAGGIGYLSIGDRGYDSLGSLKRFLRRSATVREFRFEFTQATGGIGATIEPEEKTGMTISRLTTGNEAQVYIRASDDDADYDTETMTLEAINEAGTVLGPTTTIFDVTLSTNEVAVSGMTDFYRRRYITSSITPKGTHNFYICDADAAPAGGGGDVWGVIEENNLSSRHNAYYCPVTSAAGGAMTGYIAKIDAYYSVVGEYCTVTMTFTPKKTIPSETALETTMNWLVTAESPLHWENPFQLEGATECIFTIADDNATGGNLHIEIVYVESEAAVPSSSKSK